MNKKISILLSDCYSRWTVCLAAAVPLLFGVAITGIPFASFFIFVAGIITIFLIAYTAIRASQLRNSHIDILNRRYKEDLRDFEYNYGKEFKRTFDEYRTEVTTHLDKFNKVVAKQSESTRKKLHKDLEAENLVMLRTLDKKIQVLASEKNKQLKDVIHENDLVGHGDRLREEIQKSFDKLERSIDTCLVKQNAKLSKLQKFSLEANKQFKETFLKKDLEKFSERFRKELEISVENNRVNQDKKMGDLQRLTQEFEKQLKETMLKKDLENFSVQFRNEMKKSIEDTIAELNGNLIKRSKAVSQKSQRKKAKETKSKSKVKGKKKKTEKSISVKKKTKTQAKGSVRKSKNVSTLRSTLSISRGKIKRNKMR